MTKIGFIFSVVGVAAAMSGTASAQEPGRIGVAGTIDYTRITDDESFLGSGIGAAGSVRWRLTDATGLEVEVGRARHVRDLNLFAVARDAQGRFEPVPYTQRWEGTATFVVAAVSRRFGSGRARPVVWGGGGVMSHGGTRRAPLVAPQPPPGFSLQPGDPETHDGAGSTALVGDGGVGVEVRVAPRVTVRPFTGVRFANTGNFGPKYIVRGGVRIGFQ